MYGQRLEEGPDVAHRSHVVYSALIVMYSWPRSEKKTSVSAPSPGSPISNSTSSPATARGERRRVVAAPPRRRADRVPSIAMSSASGRRARQRRADRLRDPAPVRVAAVQRGLDERRVGDRARDALDALGVAAAHDDAPDAPRALAVADDEQRELAQQRVERLAEAQLVLALGLDAHAARARAMRIAVSFVESWPSTEMRSNERLTQTPSSRSAVSARSAASVCTKQSIVAKLGWIIPAPLACAVSRTVPPGSVDVERDVLVERVGRPDRARRSPRAVVAQLAARPQQARRRPLGRRAARR